MLVRGVLHQDPFTGHLSECSLSRTYSGAALNVSVADRRIGTLDAAELALVVTREAKRRTHEQCALALFPARSRLRRSIGLPLLDQSLVD